MSTSLSHPSSAESFADPEREHLSAGFSSTVTSPRRFARLGSAVMAVFVTVAATIGVGVPPVGTSPAGAATPDDSAAVTASVGNPYIMGPARVTAAELAAWAKARSQQPWNATVSRNELARLFIEEGQAENIAGDLAFIQSVVETGWFGFSGRVPASANNFAGIGAVDNDAEAYNTFRSARIGVRAQIQHLRAYADPNVTPALLAHPLESPRFHLVVPKGRTPRWGDMGNGNWATDPGYANKILGHYANLLSFVGRNPVNDPFGAVDRVRFEAPGQVRVAGWAIDPDAKGPIAVHIYANGRLVGAQSAGRVRGDVGRAFPQHGPARGFNELVTVGGGRVNVCVFAINVGPGSGNPGIGCRVVQVPTGEPFGTLDLVRREANGVRVAGWAIDPDTSNPVAVHIYANGQLVRAQSAGRVRGDVARAYPQFGPGRGYSELVPLGAGPVTICVFAINVGPGTGNPGIGCRSLP